MCYSDEFKNILSTLADDFVDLHKCGGIELEQWQTAYNFVKIYYKTREETKIYINPEDKWALING